MLQHDAPHLLILILIRLVQQLRSAVQLEEGRAGHFAILSDLCEPLGVNEHESDSMVEIFRQFRQMIDYSSRLLARRRGEVTERQIAILQEVLEFIERSDYFVSSV